MNNHHYFIAVKLPQEVKAFLKEWTDHHQSKYPFNRWVYPEDYHITLAFLGMVEEEKKEEIVRTLKESLVDAGSFTLTLNQFGTFGLMNKPRIFWIDVEHSDDLMRIQKKVFSEILNLGFRLDTKPFRPHITLARKWIGERDFDEKALTKVEDGILFSVKEVVLYETHLNAKPKYIQVASVELK